MTKRILIIDDESLICTVLSRLLPKYIESTVEILAVKRGEEAMKTIVQSFYDICMLDLDLPDVSGLDIMRRINALSPNTKIAIMTAGCLDDELKMKIGKGASLLLEKPLDFDKVRSFVKHTLDGTGTFTEKAFDFD